MRETFGSICPRQIDEARGQVAGLGFNGIGANAGVVLIGNFKLRRVGASADTPE